MNLVYHVLKFVGLMAIMIMLSKIQYGCYVNAALVVFAMWKLVK